MEIGKPSFIKAVIKNEAAYEWRQGFLAAREAAAKWHQERAKHWSACADAVGPSPAKDCFLERYGLHIEAEAAIRALDPPKGGET